MATDNAQLKTLILEAKDACRVKIDTLIASLGKEDPGVKKLIKDLETVFEKFKIDGIWMNPIPFDEAKMLQHILFIRTSADGDLEGFSQLAKDLAAFLEAEVLKIPLQWLSEVSTSDWNLKMLEALRKIRSTITKKKNAMAEAGNDPMANPAFRTQDELFNIRVEDYRSNLKDNLVQTDENKVKTVGLLDQLIGSAPTVVKFTQYYKMLNDFIGKEIGA